MSTVHISDVQVTGQGESQLSIAGTHIHAIQTIRDLLPIVSDTEIMKGEWKPPVVLIDDLLEEGSCTMFSGSWGSGKTATLMEVGIAVATGEPFGGQLGCQGGRKVLFLGLEASRHQYEKQYRKLLKGHGLNKGIGLDFVFARGVDLINEKHAVFLGERARMGEYDVVLIDTLKAVSTANENDNSEMARIMYRLTGLCNLGLTVGFSHHTGKPSALDVRAEKFRSRGASAIPDNCDIDWRVDLKGNRLTLKCLKSRGEPPVGMTHALLMTYDKERMTLDYDASGSGLGKVLLDAIVRAGASGLQKRELVELAKTVLPGVDEAAVTQRVKRTLKQLLMGGKVKHAGQGAPYIAC